MALARTSSTVIPTFQPVGIENEVVAGKATVHEANDAPSLLSTGSPQMSSLQRISQAVEAHHKRPT